MMRKILLESREICYELQRKNVKNINIRIKPGGAVCVSAGPHVPVSAVEELFITKSAEILKAVKKFERIKPEAVQKLTDGSTVYLLGTPLTLKVAEAKSNMVTREGDTLIVYSAGSSTDAIISAWYDVQCRRILAEAGHRMYERFREYVPREPEYSYRTMTSRWGSCNPVKCRMSISRELVMYDISLIEFVFCHEYSHFIHPNHSKAFYDFMSTVMPDHRDRKKKLEEQARIIRNSR